MVAQAVTPYLLYENADKAIDFLTRGFGFREVERSTGQAGGVHAELEVRPSGARVYVGAPGGDFRGPGKVGQTALVYVMVDDVNAHYEKAKAAGARIVEELVDLPYGDRRYGCEDSQGHLWTFASPIARE